MENVLQGLIVKYYICNTVCVVGCVRMCVCLCVWVCKGYKRRFNFFVVSRATTVCIVYTTTCIIVCTLNVCIRTHTIQQRKPQQGCLIASKVTQLYWHLRVMMSLFCEIFVWIIAPIMYMSAKHCFSTCDGSYFDFLFFFGPNSYFMPRTIVIENWQWRVFLTILKCNVGFFLAIYIWFVLPFILDLLAGNKPRNRTWFRYSLMCTIRFQQLQIINK